MPESAIAIDLTPFCDPDEYGRFDLTEPFVQDGWLYATDGAIAVRLPATGQADTPIKDGKKGPRNVQDVFPPVDGDWQPWPAVEPCADCANTGKVECNQCSGDGTCTSCRCGQEHDCGQCDGTGRIDCEPCRVTGIRRGEAQVSRFYARMIAQLPNAEFLPATDGDKPVRFRFAGGGEGAVMGLSNR